MCTIALLLDIVAGAPLVIAANRDELYARPTRSPERLGPGIVGGVDELSGGTWLAIRRDGQFAAVTNQRVATPPPVGLRSRGLAVRELAAADDPDGYVAALDPADYASMNLVWGDARRVWVAYSRRDQRTLEIERLGSGLHVLCNDRLGSPGFPRGERLRSVIAAAIGRGVAWPALGQLLEAALGDHAKQPTGTIPPQVPADLAHELTAICIHTPAYGTRSATVIAAAPGAVSSYRHADGPPCTAPFVEYREQLEAA
ncbi:MAG: NRDE family protein [Kofleriaceae bacterium]